MNKYINPEDDKTTENTVIPSKYAAQPSSSGAQVSLKEAIKKGFRPIQDGQLKAPYQQHSDNSTMAQQKQQKQYQQEPQQQSDGQVINSDTPDSRLTDHEQPYVSKPHLPDQADAEKIQKQQQQSPPSVDVIKAKWQKNVGAAKLLWGKLTDDELLQSDGEIEKLTGLVRERYALNRYEADRQVKNFLDKCNC